MAELPEAAPHPRLRRLLVFPIGRLICWVVLGLFGRVRVRGAYRVPKEGGILILPNHRADVDPMLVQTGCPRNLHFVAKAELFEIPVLRRILRWIGVFGIKRGEPDRAALKAAISLLKQGEAVCIFPEGQLTETGQLQEIKPGVALIIRMAQTPVICVGLKNTDKIMPYGSVIPRPTLSQVSSMWGEPRTFEKDTPQEEVLGWIRGQLLELSGEGE